MTVKELRNKLEIDIMYLQNRCPHEESEWMVNEYAPGHTAGVVKVCLNCEKILERGNDSTN